MYINKDKSLFYLTLGILIVVAIQDVFIDRYSPYRYISHITQLISVIIGSIAFLRFLIRKSNYNLYFNKLFISFFVLLLFSAPFSNYFLDWYPRVLYTLLPFFVFYNYSKKYAINENLLIHFALFLLVPNIIQLYQGFFQRTIEFGSFMERADNIGYSLLAIMIVFSINKPTKLNFIYITIAFFATLLSLKRGAMVSGMLIYLAYILNYKKFSLQKLNFSNLLIFSGIFIGTIFAIIKFSDVFLYRFIKDPGGSGRDRFFSLIIEGWSNSNWHNQLFGNGFFSTIDYLGGTFGHEIYAHSDWLEIIYDHGLLGVFIFFGLFISMIFLRKKISVHLPQYSLPFTALIIVLFLKSALSGTYMTKFDAVTYGIIGLILGNLFQTTNISTSKIFND